MMLVTAGWVAHHFMESSRMLMPWAAAIPAGFKPFPDDPFTEFIN
jgi:hypothetical protein